MLSHSSIGYSTDCHSYFYLLYPPSLTQAAAAVSGKLILAKYVHSENEKEEEEHGFFFSFFFLCGSLGDRLRGRGGGYSVAKNSPAVIAMPGK